jgi:ATP-dependent DNA ligase
MPDLRSHVASRCVTLCTFDILERGGQRVTDLPLVRRKQLLEELLSDLPKTAVMFVGDLPADTDIFQAMVAAGLKIEGVVAKRKASTYQPGVRSPD